MKTNGITLWMMFIFSYPPLFYPCTYLFCLPKFWWKVFDQKHNYLPFHRCCQNYSHFPAFFVLTSDLKHLCFIFYIHLPSINQLSRSAWCPNRFWYYIHIWILWFGHELKEVLFLCQPCFDLPSLAKVWIGSSLNTSLWVIHHPDLRYFQ